MTMSYEIKDVLPVVHMPYTDDQAIDYAVLENEVDYLFETGAPRVFASPWYPICCV